MKDKHVEDNVETNVETNTEKNDINKFHIIIEMIDKVISHDDMTQCQFFAKGYLYSILTKLNIDKPNKEYKKITIEDLFECYGIIENIIKNSKIIKTQKYYEKILNDFNIMKQKYYNMIEIQKNTNIITHSVFATPANENIYGYVFYQNTKIVENISADFRNRGDQSGYFQNHNTPVDGILPLEWNCTPPIAMSVTMAKFRVSFNIFVLQKCDYVSILPNGPFDILHELYCKIVKLDYITYGTTEVTVEIDWFQSKMFEGDKASETKGWNLGESFIERKIDTVFSGAIPKRNTQPEKIGGTDFHMNYSKEFRGNPDDAQFIVIVSSVVLKGQVDLDGTIKPIANQPAEPYPFTSKPTMMGTMWKPYQLYIFPIDSRDTSILGIDPGPPDGSSKFPNIDRFMELASANESIQSKMVTMYKTKFFPIGYLWDVKTVTFDSPVISWDLMQVAKPDGSGQFEPMWMPRFTGTNFLKTWEFNFNEAFSHFNTNESKLFNEGFSKYTICNSENIIEFDPTLANNPNNIEIKAKVTYGAAADLLVWIENYNEDIVTETIHNKRGVFKISKPIPFTFDSMSLLAQSNEINRTHMGFSWARASNQALGSVARIGASIAVGTSMGTGIGATGGTVVLPGVGTVAGAGGGAAAGAIAGGIAGIAGEIIGLATSALNSGINVEEEYLKNRQNAGADPANTNGINSDVFQDTATDGIFINAYSPSNEDATVYSNYFKMYGYSYNRIEVPNLREHQRFDYFKMSLVNISNITNMQIKNYIIYMFQKGIHIFHVDNPDADLNINFNDSNPRR